jgi:hypothetical protein
VVVVVVEVEVVIEVVEVVVVVDVVVVVVVVEVVTAGVVSVTTVDKTVIEPIITDECGPQK